jgi:hypothetical protein
MMMTTELALVAQQMTTLTDSVRSSGWFAVLAAFVALNSVMYCALAVAKCLPKLYLTDVVRGSNRRAQTRSIYPDEPAVAPDGTADRGVLEPVG